jgi:hypothetical protein
MDAMTLLESRPILRVNPDPARPARPWSLSAVVAACWCAAVGLVPALAIAVVGWFAADTGSFGGAIEVGALGWLVAQGAGVVIAGATSVTVTAIPLGSCLLVGWVLYRAGRWVGSSAAVDSAGRAMAATASLAGAYAAIGALVAFVATPGHAHASPVRTVVALGLLGAVFGGLGVVKGADLSEGLLGPLPTSARSVLTGAMAGFWTMTGLAALAFSLSMAAHFFAAARVAEGLDSGVVGGIVLALAGLAAVPNAVLCAGAYLAGPGFVLGAGTTVGPTSVHLGLLPGLPVLAATPRSPGGWWVDALLVSPVLAGAVAGFVSARRFPSATVRVGVGRSAAAGLAGGTLFGAATWLATGSIGPGRMQDVGPAVLATTAVCAVGFAIGAAAAAAGWYWWSARADDSDHDPSVTAY